MCYLWLFTMSLLKKYQSNVLLYLSEIGFDFLLVLKSAMESQRGAGIRCREFCFRAAFSMECIRTSPLRSSFFYCVSWQNQIISRLH
mmetsp:Transcript_20239/g.29720  ORF Transcript_20239/g.29720 Transcript_20239/m.29720 type:complete len:87 (-) Transcript_20239:28-288(-)